MGILFGQLVDDMNGASCDTQAQQSTADVQPIVNEKVLMLIYLTIANFVLTYIYTFSWSVVSQRLAQRLREKYFQSLLRQETSFFENRQAGEVSSRLNGDIQAIQTGTSEKVGMFIGTISFFLTAYIVGFIKEPKLAGMLISLLPAYLLLGMVGGAFVQRFSTRMSDAIAAASSVASEALSHVAVVQAFGAGKKLEEKFAGHMHEAQTHGIKKAGVAAVQAGMLYFIAFSANALAYWQGSILIGDSISGKGNTSSVGEIYTVVFLIVDGK
jgi:ATP-binding cassette, subfamily B (MDR/TAP), member 1